jgi:hypothetical protein
MQIGISAFENSHRLQTCDVKQMHVLCHLICYQSFVGSQKLLDRNHKIE